MSRVKYTVEIIQFIIDNQSGISRQAMADLVAAKFGITATAEGIKTFCYRHRLSNGLVSRYVKSNVPIHKGTKGFFKNYKPNKCSFSADNRHYNEQAVGYEFVSSSGYIVVKTGHRQYIQKQRLIWQQQKGEIPKGYCVKFLDSNKQNCDIDNLILVPTAIMSRLAKRVMSDDPVFNKTIILTEMLSHEARKRHRNLPRETSTNPRGIGA